MARRHWRDPPRIRPVGPSKWREAGAFLLHGRAIRHVQKVVRAGGAANLRSQNAHYEGSVEARPRPLESNATSSVSALCPSTHRRPDPISPTDFPETPR
eukprot:gene10397-biopygen7242